MKLNDDIIAFEFSIEKVLKMCGNPAVNIKSCLFNLNFPGFGPHVRHLYVSFTSGEHMNQSEIVVSLILVLSNE